MLPGKFQGQRSLAGYSSWSHRDSDMTEPLTHTHTISQARSERINTTIWGKGRKFPEIGPPLTFWAFMISLRTIMVPTGVSFSLLMYYSEGIIRLKVCQKSNLQPSWAQQVLTSFCLIHNIYVILLKVVSFPLPSRLNTTQQLKNIHIDTQQLR